MQQVLSKQQLEADRQQMISLINHPDVDPVNKKIYSATLATINTQLRQIEDQAHHQKAPKDQAPTPAPSKRTGGVEVDPMKLNSSAYVGPRVYPTYAATTVVAGNVSAPIEKKVRRVTIKWITKVKGISYAETEKIFTIGELRSKLTTSIRDVSGLASFPSGDWMDTISFQRLHGYYVGMCVFKNVSFLIPTDLELHNTKNNRLIFDQLHQTKTAQ